MKKIIWILINVLIGTMAIGCKKVDKTMDKEIIILVEDNKIPVIDKLNGLINKYKEIDESVDVKIIYKEDVKGAIENKKVVPDMVITNRTTFMEVFKSNEIQEIDEILKEENYNENFYNINSSGVRLQNRYYGIGIFPYTVDFLYNQKALEELGLKAPENSNDLLSLFTKLKDKRVKIPYVLPKDMNVELVLSSYIANYLLIPSRLKDIYGESKDTYKKVESMNQLFFTFNMLIATGEFDLDSFYEGSDKQIVSLENGEIPILMGTSLISEKINKIDEIKSISNVNLSGNTIFSPVGMGAVISFCAEGKNHQASRKLFGYLVKKSSYEELSKKGVITGNKTLDMKLEGVRGEMSKNIVNANENNLFYFYNLPKEYGEKLKAALKDIVQGKYRQNMWEEIVK